MAESAPRVQVVPGALPTAATYVVSNEDHTLGNALRYTLMRNPAVQFCGYSLPHPSEAKINIRIQTREGATADDAFRTGLQQLVEMAEHIDSVYDAALEAFDAAATGGAASAVAAAAAPPPAAGPQEKKGKKKAAK